MIDSVITLVLCKNTSASTCVPFMAAVHSKDAAYMHGLCGADKQPVHAQIFIVNFHGSNHDFSQC